MEDDLEVKKERKKEMVNGYQGENKRSFFGVKVHRLWLDDPRADT